MLQIGAQNQTFCPQYAPRRRLCGRCVTRVATRALIADQNQTPKTSSQKQLRPFKLEARHAVALQHAEAPQTWGSVADMECVLQRYLAKHEFSAPYLLCCSDCEPLSLAYVIGDADADSRSRCLS